MTLRRRHLFLKLYIVIARVFVYQVLSILAPSTGRSKVPKKHHTKCFYNSHMDKKQIIGLLARGNKAKQLVNKGVKIPTKIYRQTNKAGIVSGANTVHGASSEGTCDMSLHGDGGFTPRSHSDECVNECVHIQDNRNNDFPV